MRKITIDEVLNAEEEWVRLGYTDQQAQQLAKQQTLIDCIEDLKDGEVLRFDTFQIKRTCERHELNGQHIRMYFIDLYTVTDSYGCQMEPSTAEEIEHAVSCGVFGS